MSVFNGDAATPVTVPIEDYALLSDCRTAALVSKQGSIDWLCLPRLDSPSVFGALLGTEEHGHWSLRPSDPNATCSRRYDGDTFILITRWETATGIAEVHDLLSIAEPSSSSATASHTDAATAAATDHRNQGHADAIRHHQSHTDVNRHHHSRTDANRTSHSPGDAIRTDLIRRDVGIRGTVEFEQVLRFRFDYARALPWVRQVGSPKHPALLAIAGPDAVLARCGKLAAADTSHRGSFIVHAKEQHDLALTWFPSHLPNPAALDPEASIQNTRDWWQHWAKRIEHKGPHHALVIRSLLTLRALTNSGTGGIAAAATTSLPEEFGGVRNWDYRFVWLRDAALTLEALLEHGFVRIAAHWRDWLLRAVAGDPADLQIMYGLAGERDLLERELPQFPGYADSRPVRIGNGAEQQYQADVVGEVLVTLSAAREAGLKEASISWPLERALVQSVVERFDEPDNGLWEIRGDPQYFVHSRVMMWAALDRAVQAVETRGFEGPVETWRSLRERLRAEILSRGVVDGHFVQHYATDEVDASLLLLPQVGFCRPEDPRMLATVAKIERDLMEHGFLRRYRTGDVAAQQSSVDAQTGSASGVRLPDDSGSSADTGSADGLDSHDGSGSFDGSGSVDGSGSLEGSGSVDGLTGSESPFLACSFWLVEQYACTNRLAEAHELMDRLCSLANDVGLLSEEYDPVHNRQVGNFPQAFSHLTLVRAADALTRARHKPR